MRININFTVSLDDAELDRAFQERTPRALIREEFKDHVENALMRYIQEQYDDVTCTIKLNQ